MYGIRHIALDPKGDWVASDPATMMLYRIGTNGEITPLLRQVTPGLIARLLQER